MLLTPRSDEHARLELTFIYQRDPSWSQWHSDLSLPFFVLLRSVFLKRTSQTFIHIISAMFLGSTAFFSMSKQYD